MPRLVAAVAYARWCANSVLFTGTALLGAFTLAQSSSVAADVLLHHDDIAGLVTDRSFFEGQGAQASRQTFLKSGTSLKVDNHGQAPGFWKISGDRFCTQWLPDLELSCFNVVRGDDAVTLVSNCGSRITLALKP